MLGLMTIAFLWQGLTRDIHAKPAPVVAPAVATIPIAVDPVVKAYSQPKPKFLSIVDTDEKSCTIEQIFSAWQKISITKPGMKVNLVNMQ